MEPVPGASVIKISLTQFGEICFLYILIDFFHGCTIKNRGGKFQVQFLTCPSQYGFKNLPQVHSRRNTKRIEYDVNRGSILEEWHVFFTDYFGYNTFVTMTTCKLITHFEFALLCNIHLGQFENACWQLVPDADVKFLTLVPSHFFIHFDGIVVKHTSDQLIGCFVL